MAVKTSVQSGPWSDSSTWGETAPGDGDLAVITGGHSVWIDGNITVGDGTASTSTPAIKVYGDLLWRNQEGDSASSWTLTIKGFVYLSSDTTSSGRWFVGSNGVHTVGLTTVSVGAIPATRTATIYFALTNARHEIYILKANSGHPGQPAIYTYGSVYGMDTAPTASGTVDSAVNTLSFVDAALTGTDDAWTGAWLEITGGTNSGEKREVTGYTASTHTLTWSSYEPMPKACDNTTTYTLTHNYQRAYLTANITNLSPGTPGSYTLVVDRPVNWLVGGEVALGVGSTLSAYSTSFMPEIATITAQTDAKTYTITSSYSHQSGDICFLLNRNIKISAHKRAVDGNPHTRGLRITQAPAGATTSPIFNFNWTEFYDIGYEGNSFIYMQQAYTFPIIKNCTASVQIYDVSNNFITTQFFRGYLSYSELFLPTTAYQFENIHVFGSEIILYPSWESTINKSVNDQQACKFRFWTSISGNATAGSGLAYIPNCLYYPPTFEDCWLCGVVKWGLSGSTNAFYGECNIDTLRVFGGNTNGIYLVGSSYFAGSQPAIGRRIIIKNCFFNDMGGLIGIAFALPALAYIEIQNCRFLNMNSGGIVFGTACNCDVFLNNNYYDNMTSNWGALAFSSSLWGYIYEYNGHYGTITPNTRSNITISPQYNRGLLRGRYVSRNTTYVSPSLPTYGPTNTSAIATIFYHSKDDPQSTWYYMLDSFFHSSIEVGNATIDGVPNQYFGIQVGGAVVSKTAHPSDPRTNSNICLKVIPGTADGDNNITLQAPIVFPCLAGQTITASVYVRKNVSQAIGRRPKLHMLIDAQHFCAEMSDVTDTWEQLTLTYQLTNNELPMIWLTCCNNPRYVDSNVLGHVCEPNLNSVTVYFDELSVST